MQLSIFTLFGLSALALAAPAAVPEAAPVTAVEDAATNIFARTGSGACCPKGKHSGCSSCEPSQSCPSDKPDKYTSCNQIAGLVVLCDVLNGNTISIPISLDLL
ncbi:uncharacterized protein MYCFIDRAFT_204808 [Pseudocercospora fijiensis CIRAD86]|uniref:Hydrophobin n=1 Tax=Pseudocercospora fijiensis (strain CIRAD86) TaxID=383855 RepID=M3APN3_PSEFD|nr:uncharacterized protein MYCFIDRAFT_204808 [Pseudocercospora fijiensis CIRAD86]EME79402.1 hypothetical protein MYCFIDRAFT_204808 [Pseudocercospora fijiensis CIRAD86]